MRFHKQVAWLVTWALCGLSPGIATANPMLHAQSGRVVDGRGAPVLLRCVSLSPWLIPEGYLAGQGSLAALETSPSQFKQRLAKSFVSPEDLARFTSIVLAELTDLHEGNIARFRLRPPEFKQWKEG